MNRLARAHRVRWMIAGSCGLLVLARLVLRLALDAQPLAAASEIAGSPIHAGCYLAKPDRCKITLSRSRSTSHPARSWCGSVCWSPA